MAKNKIAVNREMSTNQGVQKTEHSITQIENPLPDAEEILRLKNIDERFVDFLLTNATKEQDFRHKFNFERNEIVRTGMKNERLIQMRGMIYGFIIFFSGLILSGILILNGLILAGSIFSGSLILSGSMMFLYYSFRKK